MKAIRIFISSPGDVAKERQRAREVVESLRRRYSRHFMLEPVLWEDLPLPSDASFQQGIDTVLSEKGADIAIFILWSRLGSPLSHAIPRPDGTPYRSGTEREYDLITQARATSLAAEGVARPHLLVYTRRDDASFDEALRGTSTQEKEELIRQKRLVEQFLSETFKDQDTGHNIGAYFPFDRPTTFSQRLRTHLQNLLDQMAGESTEVIWDIEKQGPPFLGLEAFQPQHAPVFFGREEEILEARRALKEQARDGCAFLLLSGASGSGKSSLARAGVLPAITELEVDEQVAGWRSLVITPSELGSDPITALVTHLAADDILPALRDGDSSLPDLVAGLRKDPELTFSLRLKDAFAQTSTRQGGAVRLLLLLDQLEELFNTSTLSRADRSAFLAVVETFARSGSVWVLATVRSDFYQQVQMEPTLVRMKSGHGQLDVLPPGPDALQRLIEEPARLAGLTFEKRGDQSLSSRIIRDAAAHAELLPLVEFVLRELYEQRGPTQQLTFAAYEALGGVEGALAKRADETHAALPGDAQESLAIVLQALVTLDNDASGGGGEKIVRQRAPLADFDTKPAAKALVDAFITARLFTTCQAEATGEPAVTVAHESLLRVWPLAKAWAEQNKDFLHTRARIATRMAEGSPLLKGDSLLEVARAHLLTNRTGFSIPQREWIEQAIAAAMAKELQTTRRRRITFATLSLFALVSLGSAAWAIKRERDSNTARMIAEEQRAKALSAEQTATRAKMTAEGLINSMLYDLRDKIAPLIGSTELLDDVSKQAEDYFRSNPATTTTSFRNEATMWSNRGDVLRNGGDFKAARAAYEKSLRIYQRLAAADPCNAQAQRDLSVSYSNLALTAGAAKDPISEREWRNKELIVLQRLADADPQNAEAQQKLSLTCHLQSLNAQSMGDQKTAREWVEKALEISQRLAKEDPQNVDTQRNLSIHYMTLAYINQFQFDPKPVREWCEKALIIRQSLAEVNPRNAQAQEDLLGCFSLLGLTAQNAGDLRSARDWWEKYLEVTQRLAEADPQNGRLQNFMTGYSGMGDVAKGAGDIRSAREWFEKCLAVNMRFDERNPGNAQAQRGLNTCYEKLGSIAETEGDFKSARKWFEKCLTITQRLAEADPGNAEAQQDLSASYEKLGTIADAEGDLKSAGEWFNKFLAASERFAEHYPSNVQGQQNLSYCYEKLGRIADAKDDLKTTREWFEKCLAVDQRLAEADPGNAMAQRKLRFCYETLGTIAKAEGDLRSSSEWSEKALAISQRLAEIDPQNQKKPQSNAIHARFLPDPEGAFIVARTDGLVLLCPGLPPETLWKPDASVWNAVSSRDGSLLGGIAANGAALIRRAPPAAEQILYNPSDQISPWGLVLGPGGDRIVTVNQSGKTLLREFPSDRIVATLFEKGAKGIDICFSPDGKWIIGTDRSDTCKAVIWEGENGEEIRDLAGHTALVWRVACSPKGDLVATASHDHTVRVWDPATGEEQAVLRGHTANIPGVGFRPDGKELVTASADGTARIWTLDGKERLKVSVPKTPVSNACFSPDGRLIATYSNDYKLRIWDAATGQCRFTTDCKTSFLEDDLFSGDGKRLLVPFDGSYRIFDTTGSEQETDKP